MMNCKDGGTFKRSCASKRTRISLHRIVGEDMEGPAAIIINTGILWRSEEFSCLTSVVAKGATNILRTMSARPLNRQPARISP